jgi:hypothetical protein
MRRILVDHARERDAAQRQGGRRVDLNDFRAGTAPRLELLFLDEA